MCLRITQQTQKRNLSLLLDGSTYTELYSIQSKGKQFGLKNTMDIIKH